MLPLACCVIFSMNREDPWIHTSQGLPNATVRVLWLQTCMKFWFNLCHIERFLSDWFEPQTTWWTEGLFSGGEASEPLEPWHHQKVGSGKESLHLYWKQTIEQMRLAKWQLYHTPFSNCDPESLRGFRIIKKCMNRHLTGIMGAVLSLHCTL